jgi:hypothetical protein
MFNHSPNSLQYSASVQFLFNPLAYTAVCEAVWATDVFAFSSSFLSVDGMICHISFKHFQPGGLLKFKIHRARLFYNLNGIAEY